MTIGKDELDDRGVELMRGFRSPEAPTASDFELCRRQSVDAAVKAEREAAARYAANEPRVDVEPAPRAPTGGSYIPQDDQTRKDAPMFRGLLGYFPAALFEVAAHSLDSNRKHTLEDTDGPHWARGKSVDHEDTIVRHLIDAGPRRTSGAWKLWQKLVALAAPKGSSAKDARRYHLRCIAWRALALLQEDCEADGALPGVSSTFASPAAAHGTQIQQEPRPERCPTPTRCQFEQTCLKKCGRS